MSKKATDRAPRKPSTKAPDQGGNGIPAPYKARMVLSPGVQAGFTVQDTAEGFGDLDLNSLIQALKDRMGAVNGRDLAGAIDQLVGQASTLDLIYHTLVRRAMRAGSVGDLEALLKLALRAQAQSRATLGTISEIQNPPMAGYVRQANIAHGHQQVNNASSSGAGDDHTRAEKHTSPNKLLEDDDGQRLDAGAKGTPSAADPAMAPVGKRDRAKNGRG